MELNYKVFNALKNFYRYVQGDTSGCSLGSVDIKTKVAF